MHYIQKIQLWLPDQVFLRNLAEAVKLEKVNQKIEDQKDIANAANVEKQKDTENTKV
jgi:hypothetical protein